MRSFLPQDISRRDTRFFEFQEGFGCALPLGFRARIHSCIYITMHIFSHPAPPPCAPAGGPCMWLARLRRAKCSASPVKRLQSKWQTPHHELLRCNRPEGLHIMHVFVAPSCELSRVAYHRLRFNPAIIRNKTAANAFIGVA